MLIESNFALSKLESEKAELQVQLQTILKQKPAMTDPTAKSTLEYTQMQIQFRLQELHRKLGTKVVEKNCRTCGKQEDIRLIDFERIFEKKGLQYQCSVCALNEIEAKQ